MDCKSLVSNKLNMLTHNKNYSKGEDLLLNYKDLGFNLSDIIEIYDPDEDENQPRLLLQILPFDEDLNVQKDNISVETNIAACFQLRAYKDVIVNKINPKSVVLDLLEITFKDQYLGRSDMWRLKRGLINTVVYLNKKIEFYSGLIRCQVYEMWAKGEKVACGVVSEDTKIVFRSSTCQAYLFIQMSSEMWEFDMYGDLYFEKAVNGFLAELFTKWKQEGSNHDVTIVLFSRTYYRASSIEEFPVFMRECLQEDYQGRFYEDFYRVAVQNERYDNWTTILSYLRYLFHNYLKDVLEHHNKPGHHIPEAYNSNAPQGNFLEVLNISLNVFEKHYMDRSFDRTGQMSVVITPGVGVFEVDRELTNITKQRIIDNGVGSDLVCVGEQPLHAVPLLKFHKKRGTLKTDDYSMPHTWINLSFYSSNKRVPGAGSFIPRIKVPEEILKMADAAQTKYPSLCSMKPLADDMLPNAMFDYDAYDAQIFKVPTTQNNRTYRSLQRTPARKKTTSQSSAQPPLRVNFPRKLSEPDLYRSGESASGTLIPGSANVSSFLGRSPAINIPSRISERKICSHSFGALNIEGSHIERRTSTNEFEETSSSYVSKIGSSGTNSPYEIQGSIGKLPIRTGRSLINPFDPSHVTIKLTSNRRRWIHTFPKGPTGNLIQPHHYQVSAANLSDEEELLERLMDEDDSRRQKKVGANKKPSVVAEPALSIPIQASRPRQISTCEVLPRGTSPKKCNSYPHGVNSPLLPGGGSSTPTGGNAFLVTNKHATLLWGATGEQEWTAEITTGVDWKSLTLPACLPLTTDYFPDEQSLHYDYEVASNYSRVPESVTDIFSELVSQRLTQGFQLIMLSEETVALDTNRNKNSLMRSRVSRQEEGIKEYKLSIGRVFHRVQWNESSSSIDVTIYHPKHPYSLERRYKYLFRSPFLGRYEVSSAEFRTERLENYKWNYLDNYVCFKGDPKECNLMEEFKYWTFRLVLVPDLFRTETKRLMDTSSNSPYDTYHSLTLEEQQLTIDNFLRFFELLNRVKRPAAKKSRGVVDERERLGSNRMNDRPKHRSGNRMRYESGNKEESNIRPNELDEEAKDDGEKIKVNQTMSYTDIVAAMRDPRHGMACISPHKGLPAFTFISADATSWVCKHMEDINTEVNAVNFLQRLLDEKLISHLSKDRLTKFVHGFYFYYFVTANDKFDQVLYDLTALESEFHEVEIEPCTIKRSSSSQPTNQLPPFLLPELPQFKNVWLAHEHSKVSSKGMYQTGYIEIDIGKKSDRQEWGHFKYQTKYSPLQCYELEFQWMCATANVVLDLISTWQRRATNLNLHLFPVPSHPFALPFSPHSNPLRGPIVIPLKISCLEDNDCQLFSEFSQQTRKARVHLFQESILSKFGFMRYVHDNDIDFPRHFVHVTGNIIVLIGSNSEAASEPKQKSKEKKSKNASNNLFTDSVNPHYPEPCFLWTFNYMLTKRWKSMISGDEALSERILMDFRDFCSNDSHRLRDHWDSFLVSFADPPLSPSSFNDVFML